MQSAREADPLIVRKDVEEPGVDCVVEGSGHATDVDRVGLEERDADRSLGGLSAGPSDGRGRGIDAGHVVPERGEVQRVLARAATHIYDGSCDCPLLGKTGERRLRSADVPRRFAIAVGGFESHDRTISRSGRKLLTGACRLRVLA